MFHIATGTDSASVYVYVELLSTGMGYRLYSDRMVEHLDSRPNCQNSVLVKISFFYFNIVLSL